MICRKLIDLILYFQIRYLELLKLKFGEANLSDCEVMLKDVKDSGRISDHIKSTMKKTVLEEKDESLMVNYKHQH